MDGEANIYHNGYLISKASGKTRTDFPVTTYLLKTFDLNTILFGELYWKDGKAGGIYEVNSHYKDNRLRFAIFDVYHPTISACNYEERRAWIRQRLPLTPVVNLIHADICDNPTQLNLLVEKNKRDGYEGVVVKNTKSILFVGKTLIETQNNWVKIKHTYTVDVPITFIDPTLERMEVKYQDKSVGVKLHNKYRGSVKIGDTVEIEHQGILNGHSLRHPVFKGKVVT
jgi:ATP-dependent DNA ligase